MLFTPPGQAPDDPEHFFRAYHIATGHWSAVRRDDRVGGELPQDLAVIHRAVARGIFGRQQRPEDIVRAIHFDRQPAQAAVTMFIEFPNMALNFPVLYLPQALGISIGRAFDASPITLHYLGRLANLLVWIAVVFCAIKILPMTKWLMLLVALTPISLFLAASVSADALTYGLSFLFIAAVLNLAYGTEELTFRSRLLLLLLSTLVALSKFVYIALIPLVLLVPRTKFRSIQSCILFMTLCIGSALIASLIWSNLMLDLYVPASPEQAPNPKAQINFILSQPLDYLSILFFSVVDRSDFIARQLIGKLGWLDTPLPTWIYVLSYIVLAATTVVDQTQGIRLNFYSKLLIVVVIVLGTVLIFTGLYIKWTSVEGNMIMGVQGRYFIPLFFLFWLLFYRLKITEGRTWARYPGLLALIYTPMVLLYTSSLLLNRYYQ